MRLRAMEHDQLQALLLEADENTNPNQLHALVKNFNVKKKGKGKGKNKPRTCFECDSEAHIARDCPVRAERVAAGGPERLPRAPDTEMGNSGGKGNKGKGTKGEGKGGKGYPTKAA